MLRLRPTVAGDVPGILALIGGVYAEYGCVLDPEHEDRHLLAPGPHFRANGGEFWVVEEDGIVRATVGVLLCGEVVELKSLYVAPSLRRQGWGERLVRLAQAHGRTAGGRRMVLWSDTRFADAHRLYRRLGFRQEGVRALNDVNETVEYGFELAW
jgi:oligopeptidase B